MSDHPVLHWERADNTATISGSGVIEGFYDLPAGTMRIIPYASHAEDADFHWAEPPRFAAAVGAAFILDLSALDGAGFGFIALRTDGGDIGSGSSSDLEYSWTRRGGRK
jgi:hypothetical protein